MYVVSLDTNHDFIVYFDVQFEAEETSQTINYPNERTILEPYGPWILFFLRGNGSFSAFLLYFVISMLFHKYWRVVDAAYSTKLLTAAKNLYDFAKNHKGIYSQSVQDAAQYYGWEKLQRFYFTRSVCL